MRGRSRGATFASLTFGGALAALACTGTVGAPSDPVGGVGEAEQPGGARAPGGLGRSSGPGMANHNPNLAPLPTAPGPGADLPSGPAIGDAKGAFKPAPGGLRRLTEAQYAAAVKDLLGPSVTVPSELEPDRRDLSFTTIGAYQTTTSPNGVEKYRLAAFNLARQAFRTPQAAMALVGCAPTTPSDPCVEAFLKAFGRRVFRRPLVAAELADWKQVIATTTTESGSVATGLEFALAAFLQAPSFLYVSELGEPDPGDATRLRYTSWEMAGRLSFALWGTTPDGAMLDAAEKGELVTAAGVAAQAARLIASPRAREALAAFFGESYGYDELPTTSRDKAAFPKFDQALLPAMKVELDRTLTELATRPEGAFMDALDTRQTFVNKALGAFYGVATVPPGTDFVRAEYPASGPRAGLATFPAVLTAHGYTARTSPTMRGLFVRERLLCQRVPAPPDNVDTNLEKNPAAAMAKTMRERLARHSTDPQCSACHAFFDPLGLSLEGFDGVGAARTTENGVMLDLKAELDGKPYSGGRELGALLKADPRAADCVARELYRFATGHADTEGERPVVSELGARFRAGGQKVTSLLADLVASAGFRFVAR
jgi:hypothetical protein